MYICTNTGKGKQVALVCCSTTAWFRLSSRKLFINPEGTKKYSQKMSVDLKKRVARYYSSMFDDYVVWSFQDGWILFDI